LAQCAATVSESRTVGHLVEICERWIYSSCLCFGLSLDEQEDSQFRYQYSAYQLEYSHNLLFREPAQMEAFFQALATRAWGRLNLPQLKTIFGTRARPWTPPGKAPRREFVLERPSYDLTVFKLHYGYLTLKAYTKGERVLRFEAIADHVGALRCGRIMTKFPDMVLHLKRYLARFLTALHCVNRPFIADQMLDRLPRPMQLGASRVGGIDVNAPRMRAVLAAVIALAPTPLGLSASALAATVCSMTGGQYGARQAAYDLRKLRAHDLLGKIPASRHYRPTSTGLRAMAALLVLREQLLRPLLTGSMTNEPSRQPLHLTTLDQHYEALRTDMRCLFADLGIAA
ncbi:MAG: hypothetical protein ACRDF8_04305, partial [Chloroflexota bacterium]